MKILVTGGAGFIASHIVDAYLRLGHDVVVVDNLTTGKRENINLGVEFLHVDIRDGEKLRQVFKSHKFDFVNHHAAQMDVRLSVSDPTYDASVNILGILNVLENCVANQIPRVIFASSGGAVYGEQDDFPADENHPTRPISPYGVAKLCSEKYLFYYKSVYGLHSVALRYANVYGPRQNPKGEAGVIAIFTSKMLAKEQPIINGDGKQTRDYVFVGDVVQANVLALNVKGSAVFNVGTGIETDVNSLFQLLKKATRSNVRESHVEAKKGEQLRSVLSAEEIGGQLGWKPSVTLEEGIERTVEYFRALRNHGG